MKKIQGLIDPYTPGFLISLPGALSVTSNLDATGKPDTPKKQITSIKNNESSKI